MTKSLEKAFAKNNVKSEAEALEKQSRITVSQLYCYGGALLGVLLGLISAALIYKMLVADVRDSQFGDLTYQQAENASKHVEFQLRSIVQSIEFYTNKRMLVDAVETQNQSQIDRYKKQMLERVKNLEAADFFKKGLAQRSDDVDPPIRFSELDIIQRAERGEIIRPEAVRNNKKNYINLVLPLNRENKEVVGTVLLRFSPQAVIQGMGDVIGDAGKVVVEQQFENGKSNVITQYGQSTLALNAEHFVSNSNNWKVIFIPSKTLRASLSADPTLAYILMCATFLLFAIIGFVNG